MNKKVTLSLHRILIILEAIALVHDIQVFGLRMFKYYTINSNIAQMLVSACILYCLTVKKKDIIPAILQLMHLICTVCLTITFLIALIVLAPQEGFSYYFVQDVASVNHLIGPLLSVLTFLFSESGCPLPEPAALAPMAATLLYGIITLLLNAAGLLDGPYFFLRVREVPPATIAMWFGIISVLCLALASFYLWIREKRGVTGDGSC